MQPVDAPVGLFDTERFLEVVAEACGRGPAARELAKLLVHLVRVNAEFISPLVDLASRGDAGHAIYIALIEELVAFKGLERLVLTELIPTDLRLGFADREIERI